MKPQLRGVSAIFSFIFFVGKSSLTMGSEGVREVRSVEGKLGSSYFFYQHPEYPKDCMDVFNQCSGHNASGVYVIKPDGYPEPFEVYCDNERDGGGWTVTQRRKDGSVDFDRPWKDYKEGFGFLSSEFWLGNEKLALLTNQKKYQLRLDLETSNGTKYFLVYDVFCISDEWSNYKLVSVGEYSGTTDDSLTFCPPNMKYGDCSCQATCDNPQGCYDSCNGGEACVCADGFLKKGDECVPPQDCSCYVQGEGVLLRNTVYMNSDCTRRCTCTASGLSCDSVYRCDVNAVCEERDNVRRCYCNEGYTGDGQTCSMVSDCQDIYRAGETVSDVYTIQPINSPQSFEVYCNMADGGGWTVFQRRIDGDVDFYRDWSEYRRGFGDRSDEFWLGNDNLYYLTNQGQKNYELRIDLVNRYGSPFYAKYTLFRISDENNLYRLVGLGIFSGTAGYAALDSQRNMPFSTKDRDNDATANDVCSVAHRGAWWFNSCTQSHLNGDYTGVRNSGGTCLGVLWNNLPGDDCHIQYTEMKVRPL